MTARLLLLLALNALLGFCWAGRQPTVVADGADRIALVPEHIGGFSVFGPRWRNALSQGRVEEGALYRDASFEPPVQLDFYRRTVAHDGLNCYLIQGETLRWQQTRQIALRTGTARFQLALTQTREHLRLVATTECAADGCGTMYRNGERWLWRREAYRGLWQRLLGEHEANRVNVPLSVVLLASPPGVADQGNRERQLLEEFYRFVRQLDLAPAQRVAALQSGAS